MYNIKPMVTNITFIVFAFSCLIGNLTPVWGMEIAAITTPQTSVNTQYTTEKSAWTNDRILAVSLGTIGGIVVYNLLLGGGWGMGSRVAWMGMPGAAAHWGGRWGWRMGAAWCGRWIFVVASGVAGAMVGDWIYKDHNQIIH